MTIRFKPAAGVVLFALSAEAAGHHVDATECEEERIDCLTPRYVIGPPQIHVPHTPGQPGVHQSEPLQWLASGQNVAGRKTDPFNPWWWDRGDP